MPTLGAPLDFATYEARSVRAHQLGTAPSSPVTGQLYYNTGDNTLYWWDGSAWVSARGGASTTPPATTIALGTIQLAGDLAGTATNPQIAAGVITDADVNAANKDGAVGTASLRTIGIGAQQAMAGSTRLDTIAAPTGPVNLNSQKITGLATPTVATDAASMGYVDGVAQGLEVKLACRVASTANITIATPGATIDGVTMVAGDRVLLKDQSTGSQNGIYIWNGAASAMTRSPDTDTSAEMQPGMFTFIEEGTVNADSGWVLTTNAPITLNTTALVYSQFSGAGQITAGAGMTKSGNTLDVGGTTNRITVAADTVDIAATYVGQTSITTLGTVTAGTWNGTAVGVANGGTGQTTAKAARETGLTAAGYYSSATHGAGTTITITQVTHGLRASRGLLVQVQVEATGAVVIPDIVVAASGDVTVTFGISQSANTIRVTVIG